MTENVLEIYQSHIAKGADCEAGPDCPVVTSLRGRLDQVKSRLTEIVPEGLSRPTKPFRKEAASLSRQRDRLVQGILVHDPEFRSLSAYVAFTDTKNLGNINARARLATLKSNLLQ